MVISCEIYFKNYYFNYDVNQFVTICHLCESR